MDFSLGRNLPGAVPIDFSLGQGLSEAVQIYAANLCYEGAVSIHTLHKGGNAQIIEGQHGEKTWIWPS